MGNKKLVNGDNNKFSQKTYTASKKSCDFVIKPSSSNSQQSLSPVKKKMFDKNKWRVQKYNNKNKIENWREKRKEYIIHGYRKQLSRQEDVKFDIQKIYDEEEQEPSKSDITKKRKVYKKMSDRIREKQEEKIKNREEFVKKKAEKEELLKQRKKEKLEMYKKLNKKTKKGQPVMKGRIEYLLEKIQKNMS